MERTSGDQIAHRLNAGLFPDDKIVERALIVGDETEPSGDHVCVDFAQSTFAALIIYRSRLRSSPGQVRMAGRGPTADNSWASSPGRRRNMQVNRSRDTKPELAVRRLLHARGFRYRVAVAPSAGLRRRADIIFTKQRIAVFIDGCFWHGCAEHGRKHFQQNVDYWPGKIASNMARDLDTTARLSELGWRVMRFWEHESPVDVVSAIADAVGQEPWRHKRGSS